MKIKLLLSLLFVAHLLSAQREFWGLTSRGGTATGNNGQGYGAIFKTDGNGANAQMVHVFDSINGMQPNGRLLLASNGKLYGSAYFGGNVQLNGNTDGVFFEYDITGNQFRVVSLFGTGNFPTIRNPKAGVIEAVPGQLFGAAGVGIYKYTIADGTANQAALVNVSYAGMNAFPNSINGELMKSSDGYVYGTTKNYSACPQTAPYMGCIVRFNPSNNSFNYIYPFGCSYYDGASPTGSLVEGAPGKLYGTTSIGGTVYGPQGIAPLGCGVLFEYDIASNTYTKKFDFDYNTTGSSPGPLTLGDNGKLYGVLQDFGTNPENPQLTTRGSLFEYDINSNTVTVLHYFSSASPNNSNYPTGRQPRANTLLKASNGLYYGVHNVGVFSFNPIDNTVSSVPSEYIEYLYPNTSGDLIEVCRKPSYHYFDNNSVTTCVGESFTLNLQNTNATGYTWKKGGNIVAGQTTGILNLTNLQLTDSGTYTCEMVNECGTTVTMPFYLIIEQCAGLDKAIGVKNAISVYPNPTNDILNIKLPENKNFNIQKITISNTLGQVVYSYEGENTNISVSNLSAGIYNLVLATDQGNWFSKFVKQ